MKHPTTMLLERAVKAKMELLPQGTFLWVAVSGGLDSVTLLQILVRLYGRGILKNLRGLGVVHVNHNLRGRESTSEAAFVRKLARTLKLDYREQKLRWAKGEKRGQAETRAKREAFYAEVLGESATARLATAHHLDDQAETVMLRILRGTGVKGLAAMRALSGRKIRPFLEIQRSQIRSSALELGIAWKEDSSNRKRDYERNWLRLEILPLLEARRPGLARRLAKLADDAMRVNRKNFERPRRGEGRSPSTK